MIFHFLFSSITFLQLYIPIAKYAWEMHGIHSEFIVNKNIKEYANPLSKENRRIAHKILKDVNHITLIDYKPELLQKKGVFFVVDGDIYGQRKMFVKESKIKLFSKESYIVSLQEHMNFVWAYEKFINEVDICVFPNKHLAQFYNKLSHKNVYLGNPKFDNISIDKDYTFHKYNLDKNQKWCLFLFPRESFMKQLGISFQKTKELIDIIQNTLGLKVIVKYRPKDLELFKLNYDLRDYKCIVSDTYPNQSIELMTVCDLCVMFSSSCIDECIITKTPCIDCIIDYDDCKKMEYLHNEKTLQKVSKWETKSNKQFKEIYNRLAKPDDIVFESMKNEYLFDLNTSSKRIVEHVLHATR